MSTKISNGQHTQAETESAIRHHVLLLFQKCRVLDVASGPVAVRLVLTLT